MLHDVPDFDERRRFLEGLKDKFEAILSPRLVAVFDTHATGEWMGGGGGMVRENGKGRMLRA